MMVVVADASAIVECIFRTERGANAWPIVTAGDHQLHTPAVCDVEVLAAIRRALLERRMNLQRALEALADYRDLPLIRHGHLELLPRALGLRSNFTVYDAMYVALAEALEGALLTADRGLARAATASPRLPVQEI
jgi:predicted nucleic acid-binding protein